MSIRFHVSTLKRVVTVQVKLSLVALALATLIGVNKARAEIFGGIEFPQGASSFADQLLTYDPLYQGGPGPTDPVSLDPQDAIGVPNYDGGNYVTLGRGGLIELGFIDNLLTTSGDSARDLHIFEIGPDVEDTFVAVRPTLATLPLMPANGDVNFDGFFEIGKVFGATSSIDIDAFFPGHLAGELKFDAVQLIDDPNEGQTSGSTVGADIDAVGAISSVQVPEPSSLILLALVMLWFGLSRRP